jgi:NodT family efflux transporter outer membrane factor (OMF) lipoprotein
VTRLKRIGWPFALSAAALLGSTLSGCASLGGPLPALEQSLPTDWANREAVPRQAGPDLSSWWRAFDDPVLDSLVAESIAQNLTLAQAAARVRGARALVRPAISQGLPQLGATSGARVQRRLSGSTSLVGVPGGSNEIGPTVIEDEPTTGFFQAGFDASWELDLFGGALARVRSARASADVAEADAEAARATVVAEVVRTYVELRGAQRRRALLTDIARDQDRQLLLMGERRAAGVASDFDVDRLVTASAETGAQIPLTDQAIQQATQRLAVLGGRSSVDPRLMAPARQPRPDHVSLRLLPADLVRVRPEIRRAERAAAQAAAELDVAVADLYPRLTLTGDITLSDNLIGSSLPGRVVNASAGPSLTIPLFDWGARRAVVTARDAAFAEAILAYRQAVLEGVEETENALGALDAERRRAERLATGATAARRAAANAELLYRQGLASLADVLDATVALRQAELNGADVRERQALAVVALYKAVGGAGVSSNVDTRASLRRAR